MSSKALSLAALAVGWLVAPPVKAHAPPEANALLWPSEESDDFPLVVTNRGLIYRTKGESSPFSLRCSEAYGEGAARTPWASLSDGTLTLGTSTKVLTSSDGACTFETRLDVEPMSNLGGVIGGIAQSAVQPERLVLSALVVPPVSGFWLSEDRGQSWSILYRFPDYDSYSNPVAAPGDPQRMYAAGTGLDVALQQTWTTWLASRDGGQSWTSQRTDDAISPLAVHPANADLVFAVARVANSEEVRLLRSDNAGQTFIPVADVPTSIRAVTFGTAPTQMWFGADGLYQSDNGGQSFTKVHPEFQAVRCLHVHKGELWMCANESPNVEGVWVRRAGQDTFEQMVTFDQVRAAKKCSDDADVVCRVPWLDWKTEIFPDGLVAETAADAGAADAGVAQENLRSGCAVQQSSSHARHGFGVWLASSLWLLIRKRRTFGA